MDPDVEFFASLSEEMRELLLDAAALALGDRDLLLELDSADDDVARFLRKSILQFREA